VELGCEAGCKVYRVRGGEGLGGHHDIPRGGNSRQDHQEAPIVTGLVYYREQFLLVWDNILVIITC